MRCDSHNFTQILIPRIYLRIYSIPLMHLIWLGFTDWRTNLLALWDIIREDRNDDLSPCFIAHKMEGSIGWVDIIWRGSIYSLAKCEMIVYTIEEVVRKMTQIPVHECYFLHFTKTFVKPLQQKTHRNTVT